MYHVALQNKASELGLSSGRKHRTAALQAAEVIAFQVSARVCCVLETRRKGCSVPLLHGLLPDLL
jgi:hypothetical protein